MADQALTCPKCGSSYIDDILMEHGEGECECGHDWEESDVAALRSHNKLLIEALEAWERASKDAVGKKATIENILRPMRLHRCGALTKAALAFGRVEGK